MYNYTIHTHTHTHTHIQPSIDYQNKLFYFIIQFLLISLFSDWIVRKAEFGWGEKEISVLDQVLVGQLWPGMKTKCFFFFFFFFFLMMIRLDPIYPFWEMWVNDFLNYFWFLDCLFFFFFLAIILPRNKLWVTYTIKIIF